MSGPRVTLPSVSSSNPNFRYRRSVETDIRKTFARVKREQAQAVREGDQGQQRLDLGAEPSGRPVRLADPHSSALLLFARRRTASGERVDD